MTRVLCVYLSYINFAKPVQQTLHCRVHNALATPPLHNCCCLHFPQLPLCSYTAATSDTAALGAAEGRHCVILSARVHPGETPASWMMRGMLDFLTGPTQEARLLRSLFVFRIVPMLNPDGVARGNNRCSLAGVDLNRQWRRPNKVLHPTVHQLKQVIKQEQSRRGVAMFIDLHGHSRKQNIFLYGADEKRKGLSRPAARVFPKLMSWNRLGCKYVSFKDCSFAVKKGREATARVVVARELGVANSYTRRELHAGMLAMDDELNTPMGDRSRSTATLHSADNNTNTNTTGSSGNGDVVNDVITALTAASSSAEDDACVDANDDVQSESDNDSTNGGDGDDGDAPQLQEDELVPTKNSPPPTRQSDSPTAVLKAARVYAAQQQLQRDCAAAGAAAGTIVLASQSAAAAAAAAADAAAVTASKRVVTTSTSKLAVKRGGSSRWLATNEGTTNGINTHTG
eukprot:7239-Heterococcus_DN1.PRE.1